MALLLLACGSDPKAQGREQEQAKPGSSKTKAGSDPDDAGPELGFGNTDATPPMLVAHDAALPDAGGEVEMRDPDDDDCGSVTLQPMVNTEVEPGTVLVIFDNSGSMTAYWGNEARWIAAGNAVRDAVSSLAESLTVGAIVFPTPSGCEVAALDSGQQIPFVRGPTFVAAWDNWMRANAPTGSTPLGPALAAADVALQARPMGEAISVVVLTDGQPNCDTTQLYTLPAAWQAQGIATHVVGLPGSESAVTTLDMLAAAGGTGQHLTPDDQRALRRQLANIISQTVVSALPSCTIALDPPAPDPGDVHVVVTDGGKRQAVDRDLGEGGGWRIDDMGTEIELFGAFCDQGLAGTYERISIEFGCLDLPPLDPPPPIIID